MLPLHHPAPFWGSIHSPSPCEFSQFLYCYLLEICSVSIITWTEVQSPVTWTELSLNSSPQLMLHCSAVEDSSLQGLRVQGEWTLSLWRWRHHVQNIMKHESSDTMSHPGTPESFSIKPIYSEHWGTLWHSRSRHCATCRKVTDSIPNGVIGIFHLRNP